VIASITLEHAREITKRRTASPIMVFRPCDVYVEPGALFAHAECGSIRGPRPRTTDVVSSIDDETWKALHAKISAQRRTKLLGIVKFRAAITDEDDAAAKPCIQIRQRSAAAQREPDGAARRIEEAAVDDEGRTRRSKRPFQPSVSARTDDFRSDAADVERPAVQTIGPPARSMHLDMRACRRGGHAFEAPIDLFDSGPRAVLGVWFGDRHSGSQGADPQRRQ
jgi:hypothetical protein